MIATAIGGIFSSVLLGGCGGGTKTKVVSSEQEVVVRISLNQKQVRVVSLPVESSVLDALKVAFVYERKASFEDVNSFTTIEGISGHWQYEVDGVEPRINARDYLVTSDCSVGLMSF